MRLLTSNSVHNSLMCVVQQHTSEYKPSKVMLSLKACLEAIQWLSVAVRSLFNVNYFNVIGGYGGTIEGVASYYVTTTHNLPLISKFCLKSPDIVKSPKKLIFGIFCRLWLEFKRVFVYIETLCVETFS